MSAVLSRCGLWRYRLDRAIAGSGVHIGFCLHNPSTADADRDDATSRRGMAFAKLWGAARLTYINPWAGRATKPDDLWKMADPVGPENDFYIEQVAREVAAGGGFMVASWGKVSPPAVHASAACARLRKVRLILADCGCEMRALGMNKDGSPKHPLYLRADAQPIEYRP